MLKQRRARIPIERFSEISPFRLRWRNSVLRDFRVDDLGPEVDAAREAVHLAEAHVPEDETGVHAAVADVTVDDRPALAIQLLDAARELRERDVDRALEVRLLPLPVLADVHQHHLFPGIDHLVHDLGRDLELLEVISHRGPSSARRFTRTARVRTESRYSTQITAART